MKVLVTDADERAALAVTRSLGGEDEVHVLGSGASSLAGTSRYAVAHHRVPSPQGDPRGFADAIERLAGALQVDVVIPVSDFACSALLRRLMCFEITSRKRPIATPGLNRSLA